MPKASKRTALHQLFFFFFFFFFNLSFFSHSLPLVASAAVLPPPSDDALSLLEFQSKADIHNKLRFSSHMRLGYCHWEGVKCARGKVVRLVLDGFNLGGVFEPKTLSRLDQLRVLNLRNNSLTGTIPDISGLVNLKALFLDHNSFTGGFPSSILSLRRLRTLDLSYNRLRGSIPDGLVKLEGILYIRLEWNRFSGAIPPFNQSFLIVFNVSGNNLTGAVPATPALSRFDESSFSWNPGLCGKIIQKQCHSQYLPFFEPWEAAPPPPPPLPPRQPPVEQEQSQQLQGVAHEPPPSHKKHPKTALISGFSVLSLLLITGSLVSVLVAIKKRRKLQRVLVPTKAAFDSTTSTASAAAPIKVPVSVSEEEEAKVKAKEAVKSGTLVFCAGEAQVYSLEQLMRGSAELLGRGSIGSTYKAVLDNKITVTVKRFDANKTFITSRAMFERHIISISCLRHPNLVPLRAYFQALGREERLLIYDYEPNGSVSALIHGARSTRAKPLHWTSCLKIAEDVANGLAYIHQTVRLVHGNLKASNVLLGADFEARLTDYCLTVFARTSSLEENMECAGYNTPETQKHSSDQITTKSDVYAFGVLVLELLTSKPPSQLPLPMPKDLLSWVRLAREGEDVEDKWLAMLLDIVTACGRPAPEQRPTMWQVLRMIQEIKETMMAELDSSRVFSD